MLDRLGDPKNIRKNLPPGGAGRGRTWTSATPPKISNPHISKKKFLNPVFITVIGRGPVGVPLCKFSR